jgi:hypothetical protein
MIQARRASAFAVLLAAGVAARAPAQLASAVHFVTAANRDCPPMNSCSSLVGSSWFSSALERLHLATSNWNPGGAPGTYYAAPVADFIVAPAPGEPTLAYLGSAHPSAVEMPLGAAFNLLTVRGATSCLYRHVSTIDNILGNVTLLDEPALNGHPEAFILVLPAGGLANPANVGVFYDSSRLQWGIFNEDLTAMATNRWFTVFDDSCAIGLGNRYFFTCGGPQANTCGMGGLVENGDPAAKLLVTQRWDAGAPVYNPHAIGVYYAAGVWRVFNEDGAAMPLGAKFNVAVIDVLLVDDFETVDLSAWTSSTP